MLKIALRFVFGCNNWTVPKLCLQLYVLKDNYKQRQWDSVGKNGNVNNEFYAITTVVVLA